MELLTVIGVAMLASAVTLGGNMLASEIYDSCPGLARWLIHHAAQRLPGCMRQRYEEEWLAHAAECGGKMRQVAHAVQCYLGAGALSKVEMPPARDSVPVDPATLLFVLNKLAEIHQLEPSAEEQRRQLATAYDANHADPEKLRLIGEMMVRAAEAVEGDAAEE
jgi:hypothetical protein